MRGRVPSRVQEPSYLVLNIRQTCRKVHGEDDENDVALWIAKRSQPVVFFLPGSVPERELDRLAIELDEGHIVLEHRRHV